MKLSQKKCSYVNKLLGTVGKKIKKMNFLSIILRKKKALDRSGYNLHVEMIISSFKIKNSFQVCFLGFAL